MTATPLVGSTFFGIDISQLGDQLQSLRRRVSKRVLLLEFNTELLHLAEASFAQGGVQLNHISSVSLPPEALDRGVPAEPAKMAGLIKELCAEKKIPAHRVAVVLPPEVAFQRLVDLPGELTTEEAREYVLDSANGVQLPFPLAQTDFDLFPVSTPSIAQRAPGMRLFMLSAIPQVLVDRLIEMLQAADLELQLLELGSLSQLRSLALDLVMLRPQQVELVLELLPDCSNLMLVTCSGLLGSERLAAIRDFPEPELDEEQTTAALEAGLSAESFTVKDEKYLPISDLDLRVLIDDLKQALARFNQMFPGAEIRCLQLTGINSAHPMLVDLLKEGLGLPVLAHRPLLATGIAGFSSDQVLVQTGLGRLVGLALGLLPKDQLVTCSLDDADGGSATRYSSGVAIEELLDLQEQNPGLELVAVTTTEVSQPVAGGVADNTLSAKDLPASVAGEAVIDLQVEEEVGELQEPDDEDEEVFSNVLNLLDESDSWPSIGAGLSDGGVVDEQAVEVADAEAVEVVEGVEGGSEEEEWPSIGGVVSGGEVEVAEEVGGGSEEEEWPSIGGVVSGGEVEVAEEVGGGSDEEEWPSIGGVVSGGEVEVAEEVGGGSDEEEWPSIGGVVSGGEVEVAEEVGGGSDEEEWPSIGGVVSGGDVEVVEGVEEGSEEEEWPSIAGVVRERGVEVEEGVVVAAGSDEDVEGEEELLLIPGLEMASAPVVERQPKKSSASLESVENVDDLESLGELRFADPD